MAKTTFRLDHNKKALMQGLVVFCVAFLMMERSSVVGAIEFRVGGSKGWTVPSNALTYKQWAEMNRFQIGDSLLFVYQPDNDLVMHVNQEDYKNCNTATPIATYGDGSTLFTFKKSGPYYFISGIKENCLKNEKLVVVVMADRNKHSSNSNQTSFASSPASSPAASPAASPASSPAPTPASSPAPVPSGSIEIVPAPVGEQSPSVSPNDGIPSSAPAGQQSPPSSTSSSAVNIASFVVSVGAFLGSSLFLNL